VLFRSARLARRLPDLLVPGGHALLCLNAPELDTEFLHRQMREQAPELQFVQRLPNPAVFADIDPERALKVLVYHLPGGASGAPQP
jgi:23S rRNA (cytosine1962-C5)-methyltransferase